MSKQNAMDDYAGQTVCPECGHSFKFKGRDVYLKQDIAADGKSDKPGMYRWVHCPACGSKIEIVHW